VETLGQECGRPVCSLAWSQRGTYLAAGEDGGAVQIYDAATARRRAALRSMAVRLGALLRNGSTPPGAGAHGRGGCVCGVTARGGALAARLLRALG